MSVTQCSTVPWGCPKVQEGFRGDEGEQQTGIWEELVLEHEWASQQSFASGDRSFRRGRAERVFEDTESTAQHSARDVAVGCGCR